MSVEDRGGAPAVAPVEIAAGVTSGHPRHLRQLRNLDVDAAPSLPLGKSLATWHVMPLHSTDGGSLLRVFDLLIVKEAGSQLKFAPSNPRWPLRVARIA